MSDDPANSVGPVREDVTTNLVVEWEPLPGGKVRLQAEYDGETVEASNFSTAVFTEVSVRAQFVNSVEDSLAGRQGVDEEAVCEQLKEWFAEMAAADAEEEKKLLPDATRRIIEGTQYPVEVHGGETTTWHVTLSFAGRTRELEFTASEMVSGGGGALQEKIANEFFELVEIEEEDWQAIRDRWQEQSTVASYVDETGEDTVANRVLEFITHSVMPVDEKEKLANSQEAAWFDASNAAGASYAPADASIVWVQDSFLVDQLESAGKSLEYKSQLIKTLNRRDDLYGVNKDGRRRWPNPQGTDRAKFYAFVPEAIGVSESDVGDVDDPAHGEVSP